MKERLETLGRIHQQLIDLNDYMKETPWASTPESKHTIEKFIEWSKTEDNIYDLHQGIRYLKDKIESLLLLAEGRD